MSLGNVNDEPLTSPVIAGTKASESMGKSLQNTKSGLKRPNSLHSLNTDQYQKEAGPIEPENRDAQRELCMSTPLGSLVV